MKYYYLNIINNSYLSFSIFPIKIKINHVSYINNKNKIIDPILLLYQNQE